MPRFHILGLAEFTLTINFRLIGGLGFLGYAITRIFRGVILIVLHTPRLQAEEFGGALNGGDDSDDGDDANGGPAEQSRPPSPQPPREAEGRGCRGKVVPQRLCEQYGCE